MISQCLPNLSSSMNAERCLDSSCSILNPKLKKEISSLHKADDPGILTALLEDEIMKGSPSKDFQAHVTNKNIKTNDAINATNIIRDIKADSFKQMSLSPRAGACMKAQGDCLLEKRPDEADTDSRDDEERTKLLYQHMVQACRLAECRLQLERERDKICLERERAELQAERDRLSSSSERERAIMHQDRERSLTLIHSEREPFMMPARRHQSVSAEGSPEDTRVDDLYRLLRRHEMSANYHSPRGDDPRGLLRTLASEIAAAGLADNILKELLGTTTNASEDTKLHAKRRSSPKDVADGVGKRERPCSGEAAATKSMCELINANLYTLHEKMCSMQQLTLIVTFFVIGLGFAHIFNACGTLAWTAVLKK